jgi:TolB-like protein/DNA-binding winged helix-turn-helix (wHTH) protein
MVVSAQYGRQSRRVPPLLPSGDHDNRVANQTELHFCLRLNALANPRQSTIEWCDFCRQPCSRRIFHWILPDFGRTLGGRGLWRTHGAFALVLYWNAEVPSVTVRYRFDDVQIDVQGFRLIKGAKVLAIEPKALNLLIFLVENRGRLLDRRGLIDAVWKEAFVTDHVLNRAIGQLRKVLEDDPKEPRYIETVHTLGYRFIAEVEREKSEPAAPTPAIAQLEPQAGQTEQKTVTSGQEFADSSRAAHPSLQPKQGAADTSSVPRTLPDRRAAVLIGCTLLLAAGVVAFWVKARTSRVLNAAQIRSLAVLPLENLSGDASQDYLADGMTDELITGLGQISALRVISQTTAMQYKKARKSLPQIAKELNVDAVVEGSVVRSGDRIRIAAQLIAAPADKQLWAHSYEGDLRDVLGLQNQVASAVAEQIRIALTPNEKIQLAGTRQVNPRAYEALLKGDYFEQTTSPEPERKALQYYQQSAQLDPSFAPAYVGIARSYNFLVDQGVFPIGEGTADADAAVSRALELDPGLGDAYAGRAFNLLRFHWDFPGAERDFRHALELDPNSSTAHEGLGTYFVILGRFDEGMQEMSRAEDLDPLSSRLKTNYCEMLRLARHLDQAIAKCNAAVELAPNYGWALDTAGEVYEEKRDYSTAHKIWSKEGYDAPTIGVWDELHRVPGTKGNFDAWLKNQKDPQNSFFLSIAYANLGRKDQAFVWLEKAYEQRSGIPEMINMPVDSAFDPLRSDPRFDAFLRRVGLPPQPSVHFTQTW